MPAKIATALQSGLIARRPTARARNRQTTALLGDPAPWKGADGPFASPALRAALRLAVRAAARPRTRKSKRAITNPSLRNWATCSSDRLVDTRDRALLLLAFGSGGRRRSEAARLRVEQLVDEAPVRADPKNVDSPLLPCLSITLGRTKTGQADDDRRVLLLGRPVEALRDWLERADITDGAIFRSIDRWDAVGERPHPQSVNLIVKHRACLAGLDPRELSAHGQPGYFTAPPAVASHFPKPCNSRNINPSSKQRAITTRQSGGWGGRRVDRSGVGSPHIFGMVGRQIQCGENRFSD
jgi:integrase